MSLFLQMLPFYLLGNFHCIGMCGPLATLMVHRRFYYLAGRICSFTLAGWLAGLFGQVTALTSFGTYWSGMGCILFGFSLMLFAWAQWTHRSFLPHWLMRLWRVGDKKLARLMLKEGGGARFLFGASTVLLPCGQTLLVFSACAFHGDSWTGALNGLAFSLLTSPSLYLAMEMQRRLTAWRWLGDRLFAYCAMAAGVLTLCRGLADWEWIPHLLLPWHVVLF